MSMPGVRSNNFPINSLADEVVTNRGGTTGRTSIARLAAQLQATAGPTVALASDLNSVENLSWAKGAVAKVVGDAPELKGTWLKQGNSGSGPWTRIGPLPEGDTSAIASDLAQLAASTAQRFDTLTAGAPELLNIFAEVAAAIGNDPNFATTFLTALSYRLRVDAAQGLSPEQKAIGRANLDLGNVANVAPSGMPVSSLQAAAIAAAVDAEATARGTAITSAVTAEASARTTAIAAAVGAEATARAEAIAQLIGGAPELLNTFYEIALAVDNDANFAATIMTAMGLRLRVDAPQGLSPAQKLQGKANLGLEEVDNTPDLKKPISELAQAAFDEEETARKAEDVELHEVLDPLQTAYGAGVGHVVMRRALEWLRAGYQMVALAGNNRFIYGLRTRDRVFEIGADGVELNSYRVADGLRYQRAGYINLFLDTAGRLISAQRPRDGMQVFGARGIETEHQAWKGHSPLNYARSSIDTATLGKDGRLRDAIYRDGRVEIAGKVLVTGDDKGRIVEDHVVYTRSVSGSMHVFSERKRDGRVVRLSSAGNNTAPVIGRDGRVTWQSDRDGTSAAYYSDIEGGGDYRVISLPAFLGLGDSTTHYGYGPDLAALSGLPFHNAGLSGQTSMGCAARYGGRRMRLVSMTGQIPASGSVQVASLDGLGMLDYYGADTLSGVPATVLGEPVTLAHDDATKVMTMTRVTPGAAIPMPAGTPVIWRAVDSITGNPIARHREMHLLVGFGRNHEDADAIFQDFLGVEDAILSLSKRLIVTPFIARKTEILNNQPAYRESQRLLEMCFKRYGDNTNDLLSKLIAAANSSPADQAAVAGRYAPPSLMSNDETHLLPAGNAVYAQSLHQMMTLKGWY